MNEQQGGTKNVPEKSQEKLVRQVTAKAGRKLRARRHPSDGVWFGLGMMGLIGWSISVPTILGAALGLWIDKYYAPQRSWTLALLLAGLTIGCFSAWSWISKEHRAMRHADDDTYEDGNSDATPNENEEKKP